MFGEGVEPCWATSGATDPASEIDAINPIVLFFSIDMPFFQLTNRTLDFPGLEFAVAAASLESHEEPAASPLPEARSDRAAKPVVEQPRLCENNPTALRCAMRPC